MTEHSTPEELKDILSSLDDGALSVFFGVLLSMGKDDYDANATLFPYLYLGHYGKEKAYFLNEFKRRKRLKASSERCYIRSTP